MRGYLLKASDWMLIPDSSRCKTFVKKQLSIFYEHTEKEGFTFSIFDVG